MISFLLKNIDFIFKPVIYFSRCLLKNDDFSIDHGAVTSVGRSNPNENSPKMFRICSIRYSSMPLDCWSGLPSAVPKSFLSVTTFLRVMYSRAFFNRPLNRHIPGVSVGVHNLYDLIDCSANDPTPDNRIARKHHFTEYDMFV